MRGEVIDQEGAAQVWKAVYWRYYSQYDLECDSLDDALGFLLAGEDDGQLSSQHILGPDGTVVLDKDGIMAAWHEWPDGDWRPHPADATARHEIDRGKD